MSKDNSEPAFTCGSDVTLGQCAPSAGMSLRDYFAAKAMQGYFASVQHEKESGEPYSFSIHWYDTVAIHCYAMADAMLKAREV